LAPSLNPPETKSTRRGDDFQQRASGVWAACEPAGSFLRKSSSGFVVLFAEKLDARVKTAQDALG
jgi:hypothetical protein